MTCATVQFLQNRIQKADSKWFAAMLREGYRDDPNEADEKGKPFTDFDWTLYKWADNWRLTTHKYENELERCDAAARVRAANSFRSIEVAVHETQQTWAQLGALCPEFASQTTKRRRK